jgi:hypothetical protein
MDSTIFVLVTDQLYWNKTKRTIMDLRSIGKWDGTIMIISIGDFSIPSLWKEFNHISEIHFPEIKEKYELLQYLKEPFPDTIDGREIQKLNQWEKLHVFDPFFLQWNRVVFLDAGLRVLDNVYDSLLKLNYKGSFLAPDDGGNFISPNPNKLFKTQISTHNSIHLKNVFDHFGDDILNQSYFLNCIWVFDTSILHICKKQEMIQGILQFPICKTNEMTNMNLFLHFKYHLWKPFPIYKPLSHKYLFDWSEKNHPTQSTTWRDYCFIKYPSTILLDEP